MEPAEPEPYELPDARVVEAWQRLIGEYLICEPLEPAFAERFQQLGTRRFAELGSATGPISQLLAPHGIDCVAVDLNPPAGHFEPIITADLRALPLRPGSFDAASAVNCLYFLADPLLGIREAAALIRKGGTFLASAPSRYHDPELAEVLPNWGEPSPFDAEAAADLVARVFPDCDRRWWEVPAFELRDRRAVTDYLVAFKQPNPDELALKVQPPITITKSGCDVWATAR